MALKKGPRLCAARFLMWWPVLRVTSIRQNPLATVRADDVTAGQEQASDIDLHLAVSPHIRAQLLDDPREAARRDAAHHVRSRSIRDNACDWIDADAAVESDERIIGRRAKRCKSEAKDEQQCFHRDLQ